MLYLRRRLVRLHQLDPAPSVEGILIGRYDGHYRLLKPAVIEAVGQTRELGGEAWVPCERVVFVQVLR
jgi:hypothetical protein